MDGNESELKMKTAGISTVTTTIGHSKFRAECAKSAGVTNQNSRAAFVLTTTIRPVNSEVFSATLATCVLAWSATAPISCV